jgi:hypothetical protein
MAKTDTSVYKTQGGSYKVTIPKGVAEGMDLDDEKVRWEIASSNRLEMKVIDDE